MKSYKKEYKQKFKCYLESLCSYRAYQCSFIHVFIIFFIHFTFNQNFSTAFLQSLNFSNSSVCLFLVYFQTIFNRIFINSICVSGQCSGLYLNIHFFSTKLTSHRLFVYIAKFQICFEKYQHDFFLLNLSSAEKK